MPVVVCAFVDHSRKPVTIGGEPLRSDCAKGAFTVRWNKSVSNESFSDLYTLVRVEQDIVTN